VSHRAASAEERQQAAARVALLTPVAKAFSTDIACEVASLGVQVHGGMGFIEETGAAQFYRDARILPIYEGTNGIQAIDLVTRKLPLDRGRTIESYIGELRATAEEVRASNQPAFGRMGERLAQAVVALSAATRWLGRTLESEPDQALAGATPYLRLFGLTAGGCYLAQGAMAAARSPAGDGASDVRIATAAFFAENLAVAAPGLAEAIQSGAKSALSVGPEALLP
jgi:acyl-CoA dehydrogenase